MIFEPLTALLILVIAWAVGAAIKLALQVIIPLVHGTKQKLELIGALIYKALTMFRDSEHTPEELDQIIDLALNEWKLFSRNIWTITKGMLETLDDLADDLMRIMETKAPGCTKSIR